MSKKKFSIKDIPGWVFMLLFFGVLYLTGLHTEAIGHVQRILLATGLKKANVPEVQIAQREHEQLDALEAQPISMAGAGFRLTTLDGNVVSFDDLKGKAIFLNIWATWCPPCIAEMPNIHSLYKKVDKDKVAFVMLSVDQEGVEKVKNFVNRKGYTFPVYMPASQIPREFSSNAIPTTFIISPEGKIVYRQEGMADYDTKEMRGFLEKMYTVNNEQCCAVQSP